jgi:rhodanese-related sulfurtransferase
MIDRPKITTPVPSITLAELQQEQEQNPNLLLIDVREQNEWNEGHLPGATHIPLASLEFFIWRGDIPKNTTIVCYCTSGKRSNLACQAFLIKGYTNVLNLQ